MFRKTVFSFVYYYYYNATIDATIYIEEYIIFFMNFHKGIVDEYLKAKYVIDQLSYISELKQQKKIENNQSQTIKIYHQLAIIRIALNI